MGKIKRWWTQTVDLGLGTSFDHHVIAGYRFIMRYHQDHDKIFIFGFSRGAFTARFLARMISTVGLLSKGNEELVPFAYKTYQEYEMGIGFKTAQEHERYMQNFKTTFCRQKAKVHFLGLFDTVNSVGYFDVPFQKKTYLPTVLETATHVRSVVFIDSQVPLSIFGGSQARPGLTIVVPILCSVKPCLELWIRRMLTNPSFSRHAVAIDERRCKFKVALLQQDKRQAKTEHKEDDIKEVFFPGNHGDIGGGWAPQGNNSLQDEADDPLQLSDLALEWMISELDALPKKHPTDQIEWNEHKDIFLRNFHHKVEMAVKAPMHDILRYGGGVSRVSTFMWRIMGECYCSSYSIVPAKRRLTTQNGYHSLSDSSSSRDNGSPFTSLQTWVELETFQMDPYSILRSKLVCKSKNVITILRTMDSKSDRPIRGTARYHGYIAKWILHEVWGCESRFSESHHVGVASHSAGFAQIPQSVFLIQIICVCILRFPTIMLQL